MRIAEVKVAKTTCETTCIAAIPKGIVGATVSIEYTDSVWEDLQKTVVFRSVVTKDVIDAGNEVVIPAEVVSHAGMNLYMGVYGVNAENNVVIPTIWTDLDVIRSAAAPSGDASSDPSLPVWAQIKQIADDAKQQALSVRNDADSGAFDGAPGPKGDPGAQGPQGEKGEKGDPGLDGADGHTPEYGVDYGTPEQIAGIAQNAADILRPELNQLKDDIAALQGIANDDHINGLINTALGVIENGSY